MHTWQVRRDEDEPDWGRVVVALATFRYRVTQKNLQNLLLTWFRQFRQLVGRYCS